MSQPDHGLPTEVALLAWINPEWKTWAFVYPTLFGAYSKTLTLDGHRLMTASILKINVTWQRPLMWPEQNQCDQQEDSVHCSGKVSDWIDCNLDFIFNLFLLPTKNCHSTSGSIRMKSLVTAVTGLQPSKELREEIRNEALCSGKKLGEQVFR